MLAGGGNFDVEAGVLSNDIMDAAAADGYDLRAVGDDTAVGDTAPEGESTLAVVCTFFGETTVGQTLLGVSLSGAGIYMVRGSLQYLVDNYNLPACLDNSIRWLLNINLATIHRIIENCRNRQLLPTQVYSI